MKKLWIICLVLVSCSNNDKIYVGKPSGFKDISFLTITNENINGGTQIAYLSKGLPMNGVGYCFCQLQCTREGKTVFSLQYNEGTNFLRYKLGPSEDYINFDTSNWCIKFE
ncbi:MAG: hypothetical protein EXR15_07940 [Chitinophagaceae bacterium]|nr:hypothetical protein [Chitinophagaceae bacterium]